jgi:hypothetical protein
MTTTQNTQIHIVGGTKEFLDVKPVGTHTNHQALKVSGHNKQQNSDFNCSSAYFPG